MLVGEGRQDRGVVVVGDGGFKLPIAIGHLNRDLVLCRVVGDMVLDVVHGTFGNGTVIAVKPMANDSLLSIQFETIGIKKLMANFAKLTRRDNG